MSTSGSRLQLLTTPSVRIKAPFKMSMRVCGPKLSMCGCILSAWGIVQLVVMGLAFHFRSVAMVEDLAFENVNETISDANAFHVEMEKAYDKGANNCYIAALLYFVTLVVSLHQLWLNRRAGAGGYERYS